MLCEASRRRKAAPRLELGPGEMFPLGALLGNRGATSIYRAAQDTFCLAFPASEFDALIERSPPFRDSCTRRLAYLLDVLRSRVQMEYVGGLTSRRDVAGRPRQAHPR